MDAATILTTLGGTGIVQGAIAFMLRRWIDRRDAELETLKARVMAMSDNEIRAIREGQTGLKGELTALAVETRDMHRQQDAEITDVRTHFVHKKECSESMARFSDAVLKLERVGERTDMALQRSSQVLDQIINVKADVAAVVASMHVKSKG